MAATTDTTSSTDSLVCVYDEGSMFARDQQLQAAKRQQQVRVPCSSDPVCLMNR